MINVHLLAHFSRHGGSMPAWSTLLGWMEKKNWSTEHCLTVLLLCGSWGRELISMAGSSQIKLPWWKLLLDRDVCSEAENGLVNFLYLIRVYFFLILLSFFLSFFFLQYYSRSSLVIYFKYNSVYMSIPNSQTILHLSSPLLLFIYLFLV